MYQLKYNFKKKIEYLSKRFLLRKRTVIDERYAAFIVINGKKYINFASNDYLALSDHPKIRDAYSHGFKKHGFGSASSCSIAGYSHIHQEFEARISDWLGVDQTIFFPAGYLANIGVISALSNRKSIIAADKLCHASIIDGIHLSRAKYYRYKHNSLDDLKLKIIKQCPNFIITEGVFSMEGDIAPLKSIKELSTVYSITTIIDDSHGIGVLGENGRGILEHTKINNNQATCLVASLGKAFNSVGAIVAGDKYLIESILQSARAYRYSTSLPPALCNGLITVLDRIREEGWRRIKLNEIIQFFIDQALKLGLQLTSTALTPIKSIIIGSNENVLNLQRYLFQHGFYTACIRPPTVPENTARLRVSLNCMHTKQEVNELLELIAYKFRDKKK